MILAGLVSASAVFAVTFTESGTHNTRNTGQTFTGVVAGDNIVGTTTGTSTSSTTATAADYYNIGMAAQSVAIYENRIALTSSIAGHSGSIRGMTVSAGVASTTSDADLQSTTTTTTPARFNQWYSFGAAHTVQYRVTGTTSTTAQYSADITQRIVTPTNLGTVQFGALTIATESALADTELFVYDSAFNLVYLNDDDGAVTESSINATLANGQTYYIAVGRYNSATSTINTLAGRGGVAGDFLTGSVHLNSGLITSASTSTTSSSFDLLFGSTVVGTGAWTGISDAYKVHWYTVQAVPEPGTMLALAAGLSAIAARRRRKS